MKALASFDNPIDAHLVKTKLESEGIPCFIADEYSMSTLPYLANTGGIRILVEDKDYYRALKIINPNQYITEENKSSIKTIIKCPKCLSDNITYSFFSKYLILSLALLVFLPIHINRKKYKCKNCGHKWRE